MVVLAGPDEVGVRVGALEGGLCWQGFHHLRAPHEGLFSWGGKVQFLETTG